MTRPAQPSPPAVEDVERVREVLDADPPYRDHLMPEDREALTRLLSSHEAAQERVGELERALGEMAMAAEPFDELAAEADRRKHGPGSTCQWRIAYLDLAGLSAAATQARALTKGDPDGE